MPGDSGPCWSYSRLTTYLSCSLKYWFEYFSGEIPTRTSPGLILGSGVHRAHEVFYQGMLSGKIPELKTLMDTVSEELRVRQLLFPAIDFKDGEDINSLIAQGQSLVECLHRSAKPEKVVAVDQEIVVPLGPAAGVAGRIPLKVVLDLVVSDGNGGLVVVDLKTSKQRFSDDKLRWDLQPACYLLALQKEHRSRNVAFRYDVLLKKKQPELVQYPVSRDEDDFRRLLSIIQSVQRGIEAGVFVPNRGSMFCSSCGFESQCAGWSTRSEPWPEPGVRICG